MKISFIIILLVIPTPSCVPSPVLLPFPLTYLREPPPPELDYKNYQDGTEAMHVWISRISIDSEEAARKRLLTAIAAKCSDYRLLEEVKGTSTWRGVTTDYLRVRYKCS